MTTEILNSYVVVLEMSGHNREDVEEQLESLDSYEVLRIDEKEQNGN